MDPDQKLINELYRRKVLRARRRSAGEKLFAGIDLFVQVKRRMSEGIRDEFPNADDAQVRQILVQRLKLARKLDDAP